MMAGSRFPSLLSRCSSSRPPIPGIDEEAPVAARTIGVEERLGTGIDFDRPAILLEQIPQRLARRAVIVNHEDGRRSRPAGHFGGRPGVRLRQWPRFSEAALDQVYQLLGLDRLV